MIINKKCDCGNKSTGNTTIRCCNLCGLPIPTEPWHFNLPEDIFNQAGAKPDVERPRLESFYPEGTNIKTIQSAFIENIELYNYINALDLYIDELESQIGIRNNFGKVKKGK